MPDDPWGRLREIAGRAGKAVASHNFDDDLRPDPDNEIDIRTVVACLRNLGQTRLAAAIQAAFDSLRDAVEHYSSCDLELSRRYANKEGDGEWTHRHNLATERRADAQNQLAAELQSVASSDFCKAGGQFSQDGDDLLQSILAVGEAIERSGGNVTPQIRELAQNLGSGVVGWFGAVETHAKDASGEIPDSALLELHHLTALENALAGIAETDMVEYTDGSEEKDVLSRDVALLRSNVDALRKVLGKRHGSTAWLPREIASLLDRGDFPKLSDDEFAKLGAWLKANARRVYRGLDPASLEQTRQGDAVKKRLRGIYEYNAKLRSANRQGPRQAEAPKAESRIGHVDSEDKNEILSRELFADLFVWQQREKRWQRELGLHAPTTADEVSAIIDELSIPAGVVDRIAEITDMMGDLDATDNMLIAAIKNDRQTAAEGADNGTGPTAGPTSDAGQAGGTSGTILVSVWQDGVDKAFLGTVADEVHALLFDPAHAEHLQRAREQLNAVVEMQDQRQQAGLRWKKQLDEHVKKAISNPRWRDKEAGPPEPEWEWADSLDLLRKCGTLLGEKQDGVWIPPVFRRKPQLPPSPMQSVASARDTAEVVLMRQYLVLAVVHDNEDRAGRRHRRQLLEAIPIPRPWAPATNVGRQAMLYGRLDGFDRQSIGQALEAVKADLAALAKGDGTAQEAAGVVNKATAPLDVTTAAVPREPGALKVVIDLVKQDDGWHWIVGGQDRGVVAGSDSKIIYKISQLLFDQIGVGWTPHKTFYQKVGWTGKEYFGTVGVSGRMQKHLTILRTMLGVEIEFRKERGVRFPANVVKPK